MKKFRMPKLRFGRRIAIGAAGIAVASMASAATWFMLLSDPELDSAAGHPEVISDGQKPISNSLESQEHDTVNSGLEFTQPSSRSRALVASVRKLQDVQSRLAGGEPASAVAQREALVAIESHISRLVTADVTSSDAMAAAVYVLSGGKPVVLERLLATKNLPPSLRKLMSGAVDYVKGDLASASEKLATLDPSQFPPLLGGHLAIAQTRAVEGWSYRQRRDRLRIVTNTLPGTLLEEAALRRLIELAARHGDPAGFVKSGIRYARRFGSSLYNSEYRLVLVDGIMALDKARKLPSAEDLDRLFLALEPHRRIDLLQQVSRQSLRKGAKPLCQYASGRERRITIENSFHWTRATLYFLACGVVEQGEASVAQLRSLDIALLTEEDRALHSGALKLAQRALLLEPFAKDGDLNTYGEPDLAPETVLLAKAVDDKLKIASRILEEAKK
jgi:chemotaxis protein MotC